MTRLAIIGGGPSGTAALRAFQSAQAKGQDIPEIVCFEKQSDIGGLWNYSWRTGVDEHGIPLHNSMYRYLWSNGPKECLEFADYTFEEHFGFPIPSFPPREVLAHYIKGRMEKAAVRQWVRLSTLVKDVNYEEGKGFTVVARDMVAGREYSEHFDYVIVAVGHFSTPNVPEFEGFDKFEGRILHAHDFRDAVEFAGKDILVVGSSYSAEDISSQCYKYGVKSVVLSYRTNPMQFNWPENFRTVPLLTKVEGQTAFFADGSCARVDAIILCTGYQHYFPFLPDDLRLRTANRLWCDMLHKGIFFPTNHKLMYLGMQDQYYTFNMFDAQAWLARDVVLGEIKLQSKEALDKDFNKWRAREETLKTEEDMIRFQGAYVQELIDATDYPSFDIKGVNQAFLEWEHNKHADIMGYRDKPHRSLMTGTMAPVHHTPWIKALDDSMDCYLRVQK